MAKKKVKKKKKKKSKKKIVKKKTVVKVPEGPKITPYPEAGRKVKDFEDNLDRQLAGDQGPQESKRGPGRPPKEKISEPEQEPELTIDIVAGVIKIPFEIWAIGQEEKKLALDDDEAKRIAEPARQLLEFYLPKIPVIAYAWISMSVTTFWALRTRLLLIQELKKLHEKQKPPGPAEPSQPGVITKFPEKVEPEKV